MPMPCGHLMNALSCGACADKRIKELEAAIVRMAVTPAEIRAKQAEDRVRELEAALQSGTEEKP